MEGMYFDGYDTPVFRPPSEARSFILRVTRGCAHNRCTYCNMYRGVRFERLADGQILRQIRLAGRYGREDVRRVFLADGDALVLDTERLLAVLAELRRTFPHLERVSSYAAPRDILAKTPEEMAALREAGLTLLYYGMESGDTETLRAVRKGVTGEESVAAGRRVVEAGMQLSIMTILGLAGAPGSARHALATARAISAIRPSMWSALCLMLYRGSELKAQFERGEFTPLSPADLMDELRLMVEHVELPAGTRCIFRSNHVSNYIPLAADLPAEKDRLLADIGRSAAYLRTLRDWDVYNHDWSK